VTIGENPGAVSSGPEEAQAGQAILRVGAVTLSFSSVYIFIFEKKIEFQLALGFHFSNFCQTFLPGLWVTFWVPLGPPGCLCGHLFEKMEISCFWRQSLVPSREPFHSF
jgi:hypothetical protein